MNIVHENFPAKFIRPTGFLIDEQTSVRVAASSRRAPRVTRMGAFVAGPMDVVRDGLDVVVNVRIEMRTRLPGETATLDDMKEVRDYAGFDEALAVLVKVNAPG